MRRLALAVLLALAPAGARAAAVSWTGGASGDWNKASNWSGAAVPGPSDDASVSGAFVTAYATAAAPSVNSLTLGAGGVLSSGKGLNAAGAVALSAGAALQFGATAPFVVGSLTLNAGSSVAFNAPPVSVGSVPSFHLQAGTVLLSAGSTVTLKGAGYAGGAFASAGSGAGAGGAGSGSSGAGGGGHGGAGGQGAFGGNGGPAFDGGSVPADGGAGGGGGTASLGGAGGGFLLVDATSATLDGLIDASGADGGSSGFQGGGGGAGGAVVVNAQYLTGGGTIRADGGAGGTGATYGGGGGGGGRLRLSASNASSLVFHSFALSVAAGTFGGGSSFGSAGSPGARYADPRHWTGGGANALASNPANWSEGLAPSGGERLVFGSSNVAKGCSWDLGGVSVGSATIGASFSTSVVLQASMTVAGGFAMAGGTVSATPGLFLTVGGALAQSGGRLDLLTSALTLAASTGSVSAAFYDARVSSLTVGGATAATVTVSGRLESVGTPTVAAAATLGLAAGTVLDLDGNGPFAGAGAVVASSASIVEAAGASTQTWTAWPGSLGTLEVDNASSGGLQLSLIGGATFTLTGGVVVDTGAFLNAPGVFLSVAGDWSNYGNAALTGSTVAFRATSGVQRVFAGGAFDNLTIDDAGASTTFLTGVLVSSTFTALSGTLNMAGSTVTVSGSWVENPGATVNGGASIAVFNGVGQQTVTQLAGNSFGTFKPGSFAGVSISSDLTTLGSVIWTRGALSFPGRALTIGGDLTAAGGVGSTVAGSTTVFNGAVRQTTNLNFLGDVIDENASSGGLAINANLQVASFRVTPGSVFDGQTFILTVDGPTFDTSFSTYLATNPQHFVNLVPSPTLTVGAGSTINGRVSLAAGTTLTLLGDLNIGGAGSVFSPQVGATIVNAVGGSTIAFRGSADLVPASGANWFYAGDAANSWLVFEGSGVSRGLSLSTNTFGTVRVTLNTPGDLFRPSTLNISKSLILEGGTLRPAANGTISVAGDLLQNGGVVDYATPSSGTIALVGVATQTVRFVPGAHALWHLTDANTSFVLLGSSLTVRGDFTVNAGTFSAGSGTLGLQGRVLIATAAYYAGQASTTTLDGASGGVSAQTLEIYGGAAIDGLAVNVASATLLTSATATVFTDAYAGGTLTVAAGRTLTAADLRLGPGSGANLFARSSSPGTPWFLTATTVSSATAVTPSDSNASGGVPIMANDGRSVDGGGNSNWSFNPILLVLLPGETFTPHAAPGKTGAPSISTAGVSIPVSVLAVSGRYDLATAATGTVVLSGDDSFATYGATQALASGVASFSLTPFAAEPAPRQTHVTATAPFGSAVSTAPVIPAALARLQIVLPGEASAPGSPTGRAGAPYPRVKGIPFGATLRATDAYWNLIATVTDSVAMTGSASTQTLPGGLVLSGGQLAASGLVVYATGTFTVSLTDLTQPLVLSATSAVFAVAPPSVSSPTAFFFVPTNASIATLGGAIAGSASDGSSVARVRVDVLEIETGKHFDWVARAFTLASPVFSTSTLASPLAPSTTWSNPIPDAALASGRHYGATAIVDDPTGFSGVAASTFSVDRTALSFASGSGQGFASALPSFAPGCQPLVATITFVAGASGIAPGGAIAVRAPDGWTATAATSAAIPPPAGSWALASTSTALTLGSVSFGVNAPSFGAQTLGQNWALLRVATNSAVGVRPGEAVSFFFSGAPPLSPSGRGAQVFATWSAADGASPLAPVSSTQPVVTLGPGATSYLAFADATPLILAPLQAAPTVQLKVVDLCGNDNLGASSGTATLSFVVPFNGGYVPDATAKFYSLAGATIATVSLSTGFALSPGFVVTTATSGPTLAYLRASAAFSAPGGPVSVVALRPARLVASTEAFVAVSVDTGTLTPGATSAALNAAAPDAWPARVVFTLADASAQWDAALSLDGVNFSSPAFLASGSGDPAKPIALTWDGVNRVVAPARAAPPGHYFGRLRAGGGTLLATGFEVVVPPSAGYQGNLGPSGAGAVARAIGPGAGDGAYAVASSTGYFFLTGLRNGQSYQVVATTTTRVSGLAATLSASVAAVPATFAAPSPGAMSFSVPALVRASAVLPVPAPFDAVGGFVGRASDGSAAFTGALRFSSGSATSDDGGPLFGHAASTWSAALAVPGVYSIDLSIPDLNLSTTIASVTVPPGGADLVVPIDRRSSAYGWAILPSTVAAGVTVSVQATSTGAVAASAFGAVFVSSVPPAVGPSSGAFALYGLTPGTWTVVATAPGFVSASTTVLVVAGSDLTGLPLPLGSGGTIVGTATVNGDSTGISQCAAGPGGAPGNCPPGAFDLAVEAVAVGTLDRGAASVRLTTSAVSSHGAYAITGLAPGLWTVRALLPGFTLQPAGGTVVSVAAASVSTSAIALAAPDARLSLTVNLAPLPGGACRAPSSWSGLGLSLTGADGATRVLGDATTAVGGGSFLTTNCSSATFFSTALPPGALRAAALYAPTGAWAYGSALLASGTTAALSLDLSASSVAVSGTLSVTGPISVATAAAGGAPFLVAVTSAAGLGSVQAGAPLCLLGAKDPAPASTVRVELVPYDATAGTPPLRAGRGGPGSCGAIAASTAAATSVGFVAAVGPDGSFSFSPGVAPGLYLLRVPGELDGDPRDGAEAVEYDQLVTIAAPGATLTPRLGRGRRASGVVNAPPSLPPGRAFRLSLIGPDGTEARGADLTPAPGGATAFAFDGVADGRYLLTLSDLASPRAYAAQPAAVVVSGADLNGLSLTAVPAGVARARVALVRVLPDGTRQATVITRDNAALLPPGFAVTATAAPAQPGGTYAAGAAPDGTIVDSVGRFTIDGLPPGTYDFRFAAPPSPGAPAPASAAGVVVSAGQATDLGVVALFVGSYAAGRVSDAVSGAPIAGIRVRARASSAAAATPGAASADAYAVTDSSGRYVLAGLDPTARWFDLTAAPRGPSASGAPTPPYAGARALGVDASSGATVDFALTPAPGGLVGKVVAPGGGTLTASLGPGDAPAPGAALFLQTGGVAPSQDPLSDLAVRTNPDGTFSIPALAAGTYRLTANAFGAAGVARSVTVGAGTTDLGSIALGGGGTVSGALRLPDGSAPAASEVAAIAAASPDSSDFQYAALTLDGSGRSAVGYAIAGLTPGKTYRLVVSGPGGAAFIPPEAAAVVVASSVDARALDLTLRPPSGPVSIRASRSGAAWTVTAQFARPVRARYASDSDPTVLLTTASATGSLGGAILSADRLTVAATYAPGLGETTAVFAASAALAATDWSATNPSASELVATATAAIRLAGDGLSRTAVSNAYGGALTLDGDAGRLVLPRGAFAVDAASSVAVSLSRSAAPSAFAASAPPAPLGGPLYDVGLDAGTPTTLARPATLTLSYSTSVADPSRLNAYWWNPAAGAYILQPDALGGPLVVDRAARTVTLRVGHFSTFVLLDSAAGAIGGSPFGGGDLTAFNFPNPFDLSVKTVTTIHGGGSPTIRGTMLSVSVPPGLSGAGTFRVFDAVGRLVRTVDLGALAAGQTYYQVWDGTNDAGREVASGLYLGQVEVGGRRKTFKMAVIK